jgi:hypothetical protein
MLPLPSSIHAKVAWRSVIPNNALGPLVGRQTIPLLPMPHSWGDGHVSADGLAMNVHVAPLARVGPGPKPSTNREARLRDDECGENPALKETVILADFDKRKWRA